MWAPLFREEPLESEARRKQEPSEREIAELYILLKDFGYSIKEMPKFRSVSEMDEFRRHVLFN